MRRFGSLNPLENLPVEPDTVATVVVSSGNVVAQDIPSGATIMQVNVSSSVPVFMNPVSTYATTPSTDVAATTATSLRNEIVNSGYFRQTQGSTGYSIACETSAYVTVAFWSY